MQKQLTLDSVAKILNSWRASKPYPQTRIPAYIKNSIKSISKNYSPQQIAKALNLYGHKLTNIINNYKSASNQPTTEQVDFVELPITNVTTACSCVIKHLNGSSMSMEIPIQQLSEIIKAFICSN